MGWAPSHAAFQTYVKYGLFIFYQIESKTEFFHKGCVSSRFSQVFLLTRFVTQHDTQPAIHPITTPNTHTHISTHGHNYYTRIILYTLTYHLPVFAYTYFHYLDSADVADESQVELACRLPWQYIPEDRFIFLLSVTFRACTL